MTALRKTPWPLKADFRHLSSSDVAALVNAFGETRNLECLRETSTFRHIGWLEPISFGAIEQYMALGYVIDAVNAAPGDEHMVTLGKLLKRQLGKLDAPIAVKLFGRYEFVIEPEVWRSQSVLH